MPRLPRNLPSNCTFHTTVRCNNKEFNLAKRATRELLLEVIAKAKKKFEFKLYALCIMRIFIIY
ncbi:transposase [Okeania sp. KiyG1]|uniref:transposase n=1 Tax=Okeania sp. KiyG1 TaxID=2720165 RepID=UPI002103767B|nr:transposase [Okeania sp. KiyG1]